MVVKSGVTDDARIRRVAAAVAEMGLSVTVIGDRPGPNDPIPGVKLRFARPARTRPSFLAGDPIRRMARWLLLPTHRRRDDREFASAVAALTDLPKADVVHAHDLSGLRAAGTLVAHGPKLIYDAHECWTRQRLVGRPTPLGRIIDRRAESRLGEHADRVVTVSAPLGNWLETTYGWPHVDIVRNTFARTPGPSRPRRPDALLYAGRVDKERDLETVLNGASRREVDVVIRGNGDAAMCRRVEMLGGTVEPAKPVGDLTDDYRACGMGVVSLTGNSFNHEVALPNKLFHAVQSGVPVVAADLPAIRELVDEYGIGECYTPGDSDSFFEALSRLIDNYDERCAAVDLAKDSLSWTHDRKVLIQIYRDLAV